MPKPDTKKETQTDEHNKKKYTTKPNCSYNYVNS